MTTDRLIVIVAAALAVALFLCLVGYAIRRKGARPVFEWLVTFEPSRLRGAYLSLVAVAASVGLTISPAINARVGAILTVVAAILPYLQAELTRAVVYAPGNVPAPPATVPAGPAGS